MANELQSLTDLFPKKVFRIPDYQRGYAWEKDQLDDFWEDVMNLMESDKFHYIGLLSLTDIPENERSEDYGWLINQKYSARHIVDGQQRLTTISILINEIIVFLEKQNAVIIEMTPDAIKSEYICRTNHNGSITSYLFGYDVDEPSDDYLKYKIYGEENPPQIIDTAYTRNLSFAKAYFEKAVLSVYADKELKGIEKLFIIVTQRLMFNVHEIASDYDVFVAFETMNNRGKPLSYLELLKNRLIYLITLFDELDNNEKATHRKTIDKAWKEIYKQLGKNPNVKPLSDNEYLRNYWIMNFSFDATKVSSYADFLLKKKFTAKNVLDINKTPNLTDDREINENDTDIAEQYYSSDDDMAFVQKPIPEMVEKRALDCNEIMSAVGHLQTMAKYWHDTFYPYDNNSCFTDPEKLWIERLNRVGMLNFRHVVVASLKPGVSTSKEREALFEQIERFVFIAYRLHVKQSHYRVRETIRNAREIFTEEKTVKQITDTLKKIIDEMLEDAVKKFNGYIEEKFKKGNGYYSWDYLKYFLFEYEHKKAEGTAAAKKLNWNDFQKYSGDKISVEHIFPQNAGEDKWGEMLEQLEGINDNQVVNSLGNLLPLSLSINISLQNDSFEEKKTGKYDNEGELSRRGYDSGCYSEIEVSRSQVWLLENIYARGLDLLDFAERRWGINFGDKRSKANLLGLDFCYKDEKTEGGE